MTYQQIFNMSNTMDDTSGARSAYPSKACEFTRGF